jgi:uncharacterized protein YutD
MPVRCNTYGAKSKKLLIKINVHEATASASPEFLYCVEYCSFGCQMIVAIVEAYMHS